MTSTAKVIRIYGIGHRECLLTVRHATTARAGLEDYYTETLEPFGWRDPTYDGNTLTVDDNCGTTSYEARSAPTDTRLAAT